MKKIIRYSVVMCLFIGTTYSLQAQQVSPFTAPVIPSADWRSGRLVCVGGVLPPMFFETISCRGGYFISADAFSAVQARAALEKLTAIELQVKANTDAVQTLQKEMLEQNRIYNGELQKLITGRFQNLPAELLENPLIKPN